MGENRISTRRLIILLFAALMLAGSLGACGNPYTSATDPEFSAYCRDNPHVGTCP